MLRSAFAACLFVLAASAASAQTTAPRAPASPPAAVAPPSGAATGAAVEAGRGTPSPGDVWVNASSKKYHCAGSRSYGKTKKGSYMTEAAAKAAGDKPAGGKVCTKS